MRKNADFEPKSAKLDIALTFFTKTLDFDEFASYIGVRHSTNSRCYDAGNAISGPKTAIIADPDALEAPQA